MWPQVLKGWSLNDTTYENTTSLLKKNCNVTDDAGSLSPLTGAGAGGVVKYEKYECGYLFANWGIGDVGIGEMHVHSVWLM